MAIDPNERTPDGRRLHVPRLELFEMAKRASAEAGGANVYFKCTCEACGERVILQEPNMLYENGECCRCGHVQPITAGGFMLEL